MMVKLRIIAGILFVLGIAVGAMFAQVGQDSKANAANGQVIIIDEAKLDNNDWTKLKIKATVSGFTVTTYDDLRVVIGVANGTNGESTYAVSTLTK